MTAIVAERPKGRKDSYGKNRRSQRAFIILNVFEEIDARAALAEFLTANNLTTLNGNVIDTTDVDDFHPGMWDATVVWISPEAKEQQDKNNPDNKEEGEFRFGFEIAAGTQKITKALDHNIFVRSGETAPEKTYVIANGEGVDITVSEYSWFEVWTMNKSELSTDYIKGLRALAGRTNTGEFRGFDPGEVMFMGCSGSPGKDAEKVDIDFKFRAGENRDDLEVDDITGIEKKAWEYLWVEPMSKEDAGSNSIVTAAKAVHVYQVAEEGDFEDIGIGTEELEL